MAMWLLPRVLSEAAQGLREEGLYHLATGRLGDVDVAFLAVGDEVFVELLRDGAPSIREPSTTGVMEAFADTLEIRSAGRVVSILFEASGDILDGRLLVPVGDGPTLLDVEDEARRDDVSLPTWLRARPRVAFLGEWPGGPEPAASPEEEVAAFRAVTEAKAQATLAMTAIATDWDVPPEPPWETIRYAARDLGMELGRDKADVRTSLAGLLSPRDLADLLDGGTRDAGILSEDGLFALVDRERGPLGVVPGCGPYPHGTLVLRVGADVLAGLTLAQARDLASDGYTTSGGNPVGLADTERIAFVDVVALGARPVVRTVADSPDTAR